MAAQYYPPSRAAYDGMYDTKGGIFLMNLFSNYDVTFYPTPLRMLDLLIALV